MFDFLKPILYVTIAPTLLTVRNLRSGRVVAEVPEVAIAASSEPKVLAVGAEARAVAAAQSAQVVNPFAHPRSLLSDFTAAEQLLRHQVRRAMERSFIALSPTIIMHPLGDPAGGFTQIERRAFRELAVGAGAASVYLKEGEPLTEQEILRIRNEGI